MKNGEQSASPIHATEQTFHNQDPAIPQSGLTKREHFAILCMQGLLANESPELVCSTKETLCRHAIEHTDALLKELDK